MATFGPAHHHTALTWAGVLLHSLIPLTIGNVIGGTLLLGLMDWFVCLRRLGA